jgi:hypothetical protein
MVNKVSLISLIGLLWIFASVWCFNHVDAWVGIGAFALGIYISAKQIFKNNKKSEEK